MIPRIAIVTGASSGIGKATAVALARRGFTIGIGYCRDAAGAQSTADEVEKAGSDWHLFALDLRRPESAADALTDVIDTLGGAGVFVNNAGVNRRSPVLEESLDDWERVVTTDLTGPFLCAQTAARRMVAAGGGGRIVNVTSVHEHVPILGGGAYCAAKAGLGLLTKVMALELAPHSITVNAIAPGETATPMNGVTENVDVAEIARPAIPVGRPGRATEVASLIAYLASDEAAYITGASLIVDGGLTLMSAITNQVHPEGLPLITDPWNQTSFPTRRGVLP
jgi:NAD(P)-dependent dehydrogenase (short-subunit alcohol dehydrogenase family)